jgi:hypothetical protein
MGEFGGDRDEPTVAVPRTAVEECDRLIDAYARHANRQRNLAWLASLLIIFASSLIPVSIVLSTATGDFAFGKLLPSLLAAVAAGAAGAAHIVRPYDRWRIFNRQRYLLEAERLSYMHRLGDYAFGDADRLLLNRIVEAHRAVTDEYQTLVPSTTAQALTDSGHRPAAP